MLVNTYNQNGEKVGKTELPSDPPKIFFENI